MTYVPKTTFAIVEIAHPELHDVHAACADCLALAESAAVLARATGSVGAQYASNGGHYATVHRVIGDLVVLD